MNDIALKGFKGDSNVTVHPLAGMRLLRLGTSPVGDRLQRLLEDQGAIAQAAPPSAPNQARPKSADIDIVIDDRTGIPDKERNALPYRSLNSRIIYVKFTDFPPTHPRWTGQSHLVDEMIHAELGLNRMTGDEVVTEPFAIASSLGAFWGALYVAGALLNRDRTGVGGEFELPLFSMTTTALGRKLQSMADASLLDPMAEPHLDLMRIFTCADGRHVQLHGSFPSFAEAVCVAMGREDWREEAGAALVSLPSKALADHWHARLAEQFLQRPAAEWETAVLEAGGACTLCRTREEWTATEHSREAQLLVPSPDAGASATTMGSAVRISVSEAGDRGSSSKSSGADRTPQSEQATSLPLSGIKVLDFCLILAGPTCGRTLAEFGADVIKIDAPNRLLNNTYGWIDVNRGKRSLLVDMKTPAGLEIVHRLIETADVLIENLRDGKLGALGLGFDDVARLRPGIVYGSFNAFDYEGSWSHFPGWEHSAQAATGMQMARWRNGAPQQVPVPLNDYGTGLLGAYGVMLGLRKAKAECCSVRVRGSLSRTSLFVQAEHFSGSVGPAAVSTELYRCADGWIRALASDQASAKAGRDKLADELSAVPCRVAIDMLKARGIFATIERTVADLKADPWLQESGLLIEWEHSHWGRLKQVVAVPAAADITIVPGEPASDPGNDSSSILSDLGYSSDEIERLMAVDAVRGRMPLWS